MLLEPLESRHLASAAPFAPLDLSGAIPTAAIVARIYRRPLVAADFTTVVDSNGNGALDLYDWAVANRPFALLIATTPRSLWISGPAARARIAAPLFSHRVSLSSKIIRPDQLGDL